MTHLALLLAKISTLLISLLNLGSGSTWPGHIALKYDPRFVKNLLKKNDFKIILVAGTNGKTTTAKLLSFLLEKNKRSVFHNEEGANLLNGIASSLIRNSDIGGKIKKQVAIFEVDENALPSILKQVKPDTLILLNLFRDQLDRYGEVTSISDKWYKALKDLSDQTQIIINGDDPQLAYLGTQLQSKVSFFGIAPELMLRKELPHDVDSIYCPNCKKKLTFSAIAYSHLGDFSCTNCDFKHPKTTTYSHLSLSYSLKGDYIIYNTNAVLLALSSLFNLSVDTLASQLNEFKPAFGRQEIIEYQGKKVFLLLSKNPTGFNQSISTVLSLHEQPFSSLVLLNDRIADGRDVSWIWDVDFENLLPHTKTLTISGDRTYDMAIRIQYAADFDIADRQVHVEKDIKKALFHALEKTGEHEVLYVLATYTAMLDVRKLLLGKKLL